MHMNNTLESQRIFPYVAWALVIGFAFFTYTLTMQLKAELGYISTSVENVNDRIDRLEENIGE